MFLRGWCQRAVGCLARTTQIVIGSCCGDPMCESTPWLPGHDDLRTALVSTVVIIFVELRWELEVLRRFQAA